MLMTRTIIALAAAAALGPAGCSSSLPVETDPTQGREVLKRVLDGWTEGKKPEDLKTANPPVVANDPDWAAGFKLTKYEIDPTDGRMGVDLLVKVKLTMTGPDGVAKQKQVKYTVAIGSQTVVLRKE
jgi:hypothetical protein